MIKIINFNDCKLVPLNESIIKEIYSWEYESPYDIYNLSLNEYLLDKNTWGIEQFTLINGSEIIAQLACQIEDDNLWVGWSLKPKLCGNGNESLFVKKCISELVSFKNYNNKYIFLKVIDWNKRAIRSYEKIGFVYYKNKVREIENTNETVNFYIMRKYNTASNIY